jgi:integrase
MKQRFRLFRRNGIFYTHDSLTGKQSSLETRDRCEAYQLFSVKTQAYRQAHLNLRLARTYLTATDPLAATRPWQTAMDELVKSKHGKWGERWGRAIKEKPFDLIRNLPIIETHAEHFLKVLLIGTVSTNVYLRRMHNFVLDMGWLPCPILPKRQWPAVRYKEKRAITHEEHLTILKNERFDERRAYYQLCWHLGGSQSDIANLHAGDVDWRDHVISFARSKTKVVQIQHFGEEVEAILRNLPKEGLLFPSFAAMDEKHRACWFQVVCRRVGIDGVSLHSYRYAWAERAKVCGYPERFAQEALGHNSKAVHRAYARKAKVKLPSLEEYEMRARRGELMVFPMAQETETNRSLVFSRRD